MSNPDDDEAFSNGDYRSEIPSPDPIRDHNGLNEWLLVVVLVLALAVTLAIAYTVHEEHAQARLAAANGLLAKELTKTQHELTALTSKLNALTTPPAQPALPPDETLAKKPQPHPEAASERGIRPHDSVPSGWRRHVQERLSAQQKRLAAAEREIAKTKADLTSNANSVRSGFSNLGGAIAHNHEQLVALEQQGQRTFYEFDLFKSKRFSREGPVGLKLRHTNTRHENYNIEVLVNDATISRKNVDLYEPILFATGSSRQALELVVNRIDKNHVHGYVSVPKSYNERASLFPASTPTAGAGPLTLTPVAASITTAQTPVAPASAASSGAQPPPELSLSRQP